MINRIIGEVGTKVTDRQFPDSLEQIVVKTGVLGVSAVVIHRGQEWVGTGGWTPAEQACLDWNDKFPIFSIAKTMLAVTPYVSWHRVVGSI